MGIDNTLIDNPAHGIRYIVLHLEPPLAMTAYLIRAAVTGGSAVINGQYGVTLVGEVLRLWVESPLDATRKRFVVREDDQRQLLVASSALEQVAF